MFLSELFHHDTLQRIAERAKQGIKLWRGWKQTGHSPADPGDFGAGTYYTTHRPRAKAYGELKRHELKFKNPLVLDVKDAYELAEQYGTVRGTMATRKEGAMRMTRELVAKGHDALIAVTVFRDVSELEVVDYRHVRLEEATKDIPPDDDPMEKNVRWKGSIIPYYIEDDNTIKMLFIKAANPQTYGYAPQVVKGRDDPKDSSPRDTAIREGSEELGLKESMLKRTEFVAKRHLEGRVSSYDIYLYVAKIDKHELPSVFNHDAEVLEVVTMTPAQFNKVGRRTQRELVADAAAKIKTLEGL